MEITTYVLFSTIFLLFLINLTYKALKWLFEYIQRAKIVNKIPGPKMKPFLGNADLLNGKNAAFDLMIKLSKENKDKPIFRLWFGPHPNIIFHKADHLDVLMSGSKHIEKSFMYDFLHPWFGTGLLTSHGEKWYKRRRLLTPSFHFEILNDFLLVMNEQAQIMTDLICDLPKNDKNEIEVDIFKRICTCALDVICETAMGQNVNAQTDKNSDYVNAVLRMSEIIFNRMVNPMHWNNFYFNNTKAGKEHKKLLEILISFTKKVIHERDAELKVCNYNRGQKRIAFLDMLLKAKQDDPLLTFEDIQEEVDTFMFEGHDTTAVAAGWGIHLIGSHPEIQKKLHEEVDSVFGTSDRHITNDDLKELKYLECVIKETLRIFPSVPFIARVLEEDEQIAEYKIPKGSSATIMTYMIHRDERNFPDPEKFDPDRFLPEKSKDRHPLAYIPFSAGKRNCIGQRFAQMEEKILLANMLRKFEIESLKTTAELLPTAELTLRALNGIPVKLKRRNI